MIAVITEVHGQNELLAAFGRLEHLYDDLSPVFQAVGEEALRDTRHGFDVGGPGWAPLSPETIKRKGSTRILRDKDDLYGSFEKGATNNVFRVSATEGEFGTSDSKAMFHQTGTSRMPKRTIIQVTGEQEAKYVRIASNVQVERIKALGFEVS